MKSATALTLLAFGAIFAFAVKAHPSFLNFQVFGWVLMLTAIAGLVIPRRGRGWLRRTVLVRDSRDTSGAADTDAPEEADGTAEAASTETDGRVERESIVEYIEK